MTKPKQCSIGFQQKSLYNKTVLASVRVLANLIHMLRHSSIKRQYCYDIAKILIMLAPKTNQSINEKTMHDPLHMNPVYQ